MEVGRVGTGAVPHGNEGAAEVGVHSAESRPAPVAVYGSDGTVTYRGVEGSIDAGTAVGSVIGTG